MNIQTLCLLSTIILLNTACSPKHEDTQDTIQSSAAASAPPITAPAETTAIPAAPTDARTVELVNTYWKLIQLNDSEITVSENQPEAHIIFDAENRVSGSDGCNRIMGSYAVEGDKLTLGQLAGTKMGCTDGEKQAIEFNDALTKVALYSVRNNQLELIDSTESVIARFEAVALP
jgi:heat shock protein HslJ